MDQNNIKKPKYRNVYIVPVFSIAILLVLIMTVGYGYFTFKSVSTNNTAYGNTSFPSICNLTVTNAVVQLRVGKNVLALNATDTSVSAYNTATIKMTGPTDCTCSYYVNIKQSGTSYFRTDGTGTTKELTYLMEPSMSVSPVALQNYIQNSMTETNVDVCAGTGNMTDGCFLFKGWIGGKGASTTVTHSYKLTTKFYNIYNANQIRHQGQNYRYSVTLVVDSCTFPS